MKRNSWTTALLGFIAGAVLVLLITLFSIRRPLDVNANGSWRKLNLILNEVQANYVDTINYKEVTEAAVKAALEHLDPHSVYMEPQPLKDAEDDLSGGFDGIGIQFNVPNDTAVVLSVIPGGPSERAGVLSGDRILKVDETVIAGVKMPQDSMVHLMRGPRGTKVVVTMGRGSEKIPFEITRDKIAEHCVDASFMIDDSTAYLRLSKFTRTTYRECAAAALALVEQGMKKLIFDVRDNTGGYLDQACNLSNMFLEKDQMIVYMEGLHREREEFKANGQGLLRNIDLYILINDGSASASEIFAGSIQDNDRGVIVGRRSFGKGLVQEPVYFSDGSGIRLTVARFYTPSGRCIQKPYSKDYAYDFYSRYANGELMNADSIKVDSSKVYKTIGGRTVYGGGGIIPDIFVPMDTTRATDFHIECNKKAAVVRYATRFFDIHRDRLSRIDDFQTLVRYLDGCGIDADFLSYASSLGINVKEGEWDKSRPYLMPQIKGLCGRYSKVGEEAYYRYVLPIDDCVIKAMEN